MVETPLVIFYRYITNTALFTDNTSFFGLRRCCLYGGIDNAIEIRPWLMKLVKSDAEVYIKKYGIVSFLIKFTLHT